MAIAYVDSIASYQNGDTQLPFPSGEFQNGVHLPATAQLGDTVLAFGALADSAIGDPVISGGNGSWTQVGTTFDDNTCRTKVWQKQVLSGDPGALINMTWTTSGKGALILVVYSGVDSVTPIDVFATLAEGATATASHNTPGVTPSVSNCWVVEYCTMRGTAPTSITGPGARTSRITQLGSGNGTVASMVADSNATISAGVASGAQTFTFGTTTSANAVGWSLALRAAAPPTAFKGWGVPL